MRSSFVLAEAIACMCCVGSSSGNLRLLLITENRPPNPDNISPFLNGDFIIARHTHRQDVELRPTHLRGANLVKELSSSGEDRPCFLRIVQMRSHCHQAAEFEVHHRVDLLCQMNHSRGRDARSPTSRPPPRRRSAARAPPGACPRCPSCRPKERCPNYRAV